jgi:DNA-binding response OmpR family regulator
MPGQKILIVDDSRVILRTLSMKLTANGYNVVTAEDGGSAVRAIRKERPDLILLDITFPSDMGGGVSWDGFLIMDWLRRLEEAKDVPIMIITGGDPLKNKPRALAAGATHFFHKPLDNDELLAEIGRVFEAKPASP